MMVLGLTGGVGAGKSRILELFSEEYGAQVIQADLVARQLEEQLRCFESELADVELHPSLGLTLDPFLRILDILFDSFVTDWTVSERVEKACVQAERTRREIQALLDHLMALQDQACRESAKLTRQRRLLIEQA